MTRREFEEVAIELLEDMDLETILADSDLTEYEALAILIEEGHVKIPEWAERPEMEEEDE